MARWPVSDLPAFHDQRDRAESFGAVAEAYDQYRPGYPEQLVEALVALRPAAVLDVGCGTGKAARPLMARGLDVVGVELDPQMAAVAGRHGVPVEVAAFEDWDDRGRTFDLIVSGQAWHWVDPARGAPKLVRLLRPGGTVCLFWNYEEPDEHTTALVDDVYRRLAPALLEEERAGRAKAGWHAEQLRATGCFASVREQRYRYDETLRTADWIARISTYSRQLLLGPRLAEVQTALRAALPDTLRLTAGTYTLWARP